MYIRNSELPVCIPRHWFGGGISESWEACLEGYIWPKWRALEPRVLCPVHPNEWGWVETELALDLGSEVWFSLEDIWGGGEVSVSTEFCLEDGILTELLDWDLDGGSEGMYQEDGELELDGGRMEQHLPFLFFLSATSLKFVVLLCLYRSWNELKVLLLNDFTDTFFSDFAKVSFASWGTLLFLDFLISQGSFVLIELCFGLDDVTFDCKEISNY